MKVLQLIDSLAAGGAERMAVNYANALSDNIDDSFICASRKEGPLKDSINSKKNYVFLNRKSTFDIFAFRKLRNFILENQIHVIHAHGTSYFLAVLIKLSIPKIALIWHLHHGNIANLSWFKLKVINFLSRFFEATICVNNDLKIWCEKNLACNKIIYLPNFIAINKSYKSLNISLSGTAGKRIIHLANWRSAKDHLTLLKAFNIVKNRISDITLHLVGANYQDKYSQEVINFIEENHLEQSIFIHSSQTNPEAFLSMCDVGVLSSISEGLPMALLEYGTFGLAPIATHVGQCKNVIGDCGIVVEPQNSEALAKGLINYFTDADFLKAKATCFQQRISEKFDQQIIIEQAVKVYQNALKS